MITKKCPDCNKRKLCKYFSKDRTRYDGLNGWCKKCIKKRAKKYLKSKANQSRKARAALRFEILQYYGGNIPECACCHVNILEFLGVDHINGGGVKHKKQIGGGSHFYLWLKRKIIFQKDFEFFVIIVISL